MRNGVRNSFDTDKQISVDFPDLGTRDGVAAFIVAILLWVWRQINGDIKAAKQIADSTAQAALTRIEFQEYIEKTDAQRERVSALFEKLFDQLRDHQAQDSRMFSQIEAALARLEERSKLQRRHTDGHDV